jgi:hypothetical protein
MFLDRLQPLEKTCCDIFPFRQPTYDWEQPGYAETRAKAAAVTGPKSIFNQAAEAIGRLEAHVESFWRAGEYARPDERISVRSVLSSIRSIFPDSAKEYGNATIRDDIAALQLLMKELPDEDAQQCASVIAKTRELVQNEKVSAERRLIADSAHGSPSNLLGKVGITVFTIMADAQVHGRYHHDLAHTQYNFVRKALAP